MTPVVKKKTKNKKQTHTQKNKKQNKKNPSANVGNRRLPVQSWVGKIPLRRAWQPTLVFLPGESHGHRSLVGYSP